MHVDRNTGIATIWLLKERRGETLVSLPPSEQRWVKRWSIDARELIAAGEASESKPNEPQAMPAGFTADGPPDAKVLAERLGRLPKQTLIELCDKNRVPWVKTDGKASLIAKLQAVSVTDIPEPTTNLVGATVTEADTE